MYSFISNSKIQKTNTGMCSNWSNYCYTFHAYRCLVAAYSMSTFVADGCPSHNTLDGTPVAVVHRLEVSSGSTLYKLSDCNTAERVHRVENVVGSLFPEIPREAPDSCIDLPANFDEGVRRIHGLSNEPSVQSLRMRKAQRRDFPDSADVGCDHIID